MGKVKQHYTMEAEKKLEALATMLKQKLITPEYVRKQIKGDQAIQLFAFNCDEDEVDDTVVASILDALGYEVDQDYEDTAEGLTALTKDMADRLANDKMDQVLEKFPLVKNHLQYVLNGGQSQDFMQAYDPNMDYNTLRISEGDVSSQKAILGDYLAIKGHDGEFINEMLEDYEACAGIQRAIDEVKNDTLTTIKKKIDEIRQDKRNS